MAQVPALKKILVEDFPKQYQDLISKIAYPFNTAIENIVDTINGDIDISNTTFQYKQVTFTTSATGQPASTAQFLITTVNKPIGMQVIQAVNNTSSTTYPTGAPFISYTIDQNNIATINNITGLAPSSNYTINIIVFS